MFRALGGTITNQDMDLVGPRIDLQHFVSLPHFDFMMKQKLAARTFRANSQLKSSLIVINRHFVIGRHFVINRHFVIGRHFVINRHWSSLGHWSSLMVKA